MQSTLEGIAISLPQVFFFSIYKSVRLLFVVVIRLPLSLVLLLLFLAQLFQSTSFSHRFHWKPGTAEAFPALRLRILRYLGPGSSLPKHSTNYIPYGHLNIIFFPLNITIIITTTTLLLRLFWWWWFLSRFNQYKEIVFLRLVARGGGESKGKKEERVFQSRGNATLTSKSKWESQGEYCKGGCAETGGEVIQFLFLR